MVVPAQSCLMSTLPAVSRGGTVRSASNSSGGSTNPPRSRSSFSRFPIVSINPREGASPIVPGNGAPLMRTRGRSGESAKPSAIRQRTRNGSLKTSRRKPKPGIWQVNPHEAGSTSRIFTSRRSPGSAPFT